MSWYVVMRNVFQFYCLTVLPGFATVLVDKFWQLFSVLLVHVIDIFGNMMVVGPRASFSDRGLRY